MKKLIGGSVVLIFSLLYSQPARLDTSDSVIDAVTVYNPILGAGLKIFDLLFGSDDEPVKLAAKKHYRSCNFSINPIDGWKIIAEPSGVTRIPAASETVWFQKDSAMMQVICVPKTVTLKQWATGTLINLPRSYTGYKMLAQETIQFKGVPAHWIAYKGAPLGFTEVQRGYLLLVDRADDTGLIASIAVPKHLYEQYAPSFRAAVKSITLN